MSRHPDLDALAREMRGRPPLRGSLLLGVILLCIITALIWAERTELDDVVRVDGRVVPSINVQVIEATEPGVVQALHVREGQIVEAGDLLMELDTTQIASELNTEQQRAFGLMARAQRLEAEIAGSALEFAEELVTEAAEVVHSETALFKGRQAELSAEIAILERQREQRQRKFEESLVDQDTAIETLALLAEEHAIIKPLVDQRMEPATTLLALKRNKAEWQGRETRAKAVVRKLQTGLDEIDDRISATRSRFRSAALADLAAVTAELSALRQILPALRNRAARAQIRSPVRGVINRIHRTTIGGLARGGEELIEVVPLDDTLLVEAYVRPKDIAFLHVGQPVKVKITAYDFKRYGSLGGEITRIGADTVARSELSDEEVFVVEIRTVEAKLGSNDQAVEIMPGMITEVDILSGRKSVLEYVIQPVLKVKNEALRE
ncbi:MAG: HlyD family type I secretion periplasmic adaptor subunit [Ruegeria sp.]